MFFFIVMVLVNIIFMIYWLYKMFFEVKNTFRDKLAKVYILVCLWGKKDKFEEEKRRRVIKDEHDLLKEDFEIELANIHKLLSSNPKWVGFWCIYWLFYRKNKLVLTDISIAKVRKVLDVNAFLKNTKDHRDLMAIPEEGESINLFYNAIILAYLSLIIYITK